jgi:hypothetical protein
MKKLVILAVFLAFSANALSSQNMTGQDLYNGFQAQKRIDSGSSSKTDYDSRARVVGYIQGSIDMLNVISTLNGNVQFPDYPSGTTLGQVIKIIENYIEKKPEQWNLPGSALIYFALIDAYGKKI